MASCDTNGVRADPPANSTLSLAHSGSRVTLNGRDDLANEPLYGGERARDDGLELTDGRLDIGDDGGRRKAVGGQDVLDYGLGVADLGADRRRNARDDGNDVGALHVLNREGSVRT